LAKTTLSIVAINVKMNITLMLNLAA